MPSELRPKRTWLQKPLSASMGAAQLPATRLVANWKRGLFPTDTSYEPANLLTDDRARRARIAAQWAQVLDATLPGR